jgi:hypothetical protein
MVAGDVTSWQILLQKSQNAERLVPHINIRSPRLQPGKFLIGGAKRLLHQNRPKAELPLTKMVCTLIHSSGSVHDVQIDELRYTTEG